MDKVLCTVPHIRIFNNIHLSYDVVSESVIKPCIKKDNPLVY